jgi:xanthine dehydrogenase/oxidase
MQNEYFLSYKQSRRREDDIAIVNAGFRVLLEPQRNKVKEISLCYGGMHYKTVSASKTEGHLKGR